MCSFQIFYSVKYRGWPNKKKYFVFYCICLQNGRLKNVPPSSFRSNISGTVDPKSKNKKDL